MGKARYAAFVALLAAALLTALAASVALGAVPLRPADLARALRAAAAGLPQDEAGIIFLELRLPRALLAAAVGAALAVAGAGFQGFFRNPLADPYIIGASSGAALGAAVAIALGFGGFAFASGPAIAAFAGALLATFLAFAVARSVGDPPPAAALLLAGTALSALFSAALSFVVVVKDKDLHKIYYWLLGGFGGTSWTDLAASVPFMAAGCLLVAAASRPLDLLAFGEETARGAGLDVKKARLVVALGSSLAAAAAVSTAGIVAFVGLVAPHAARLIVGPAHRRLLPASALAGALLVVAADLAARTAVAPSELPIGVVTSAIGAPFFLFLLARLGRRLGGAR